MKVWKKRYTQVDVARYYEQKANRPGSTGTFYFILRSRAIRACHQAAEAAAAGRRKTDLGKSTLLFRLQPKGGTGSAYLLFGTLVGWLLVGFAAAKSRNASLFFFISADFRGYPG